MRSDLKRFGRGFIYAWNGIWAAIREERNFRFHLCTAVYAFAAAAIAGLDAVELALVSLCIFSVIQAELMNSAVERAVDKPDTSHWWSAGAAKDMAAGGVLMTAVGALCVGGFLFLQPERLQKLWAAVTVSPWATAAVLISFVIAYLFIFRFGGASQKKGLSDADKKE